MEHLSIEEINRIDLVDYLSSIGIQPKKRKAHRYYYLSPLAGHPEHRPTFIVNRHLNRWRETTTKEMGGLTDLTVRLYACTIGELTAILQAALPPKPQPHSTNGPGTSSPIAIERTLPIRSSYLERHLWERRIPLHVARLICQEAWYHRDNRLYHALAFPNDAGGFELFDRNRQFRVPPCGPTHLRHQSQHIAIFREIFDLLTYIALNPGPIHELPDLLVLNGPISFLAIKAMITPYRHKHLFLPNDAAGIAFSTLAAHTLANVHDHRSLYQGYATLNDWICRIGTSPGPEIPPSPCSKP